MSEGNVPCHGENPLLPPEVVCFGMITSAVVLVVDRFPEHNTGTYTKQVAEFVSDDAAIVACLLRQWGSEERPYRDRPGRRPPRSQGGGAASRDWASWESSACRSISRPP